MGNGGGPRAADYGDAWADQYDELHAGLRATDAAVALLEELAREAAGAGRRPRVLELGAGTGRIAIPLARATDVVALDASRAMLDRLRAKAGDVQLETVEGDMVDPAVDGPFDLVIVVFNTLYLLPDQEEQVRCFAATARLLAPGGRFVVEGFVPDPTRFTDDQRVAAEAVSDRHVVLEAASHDAAAQEVRSARVVVGDDGIRVLPVALRYAWPAEMDLMARLAGLRLERRWGGWLHEPFTSDSRQHVSAYARAR